MAGAVLPYDWLKYLHESAEVKNNSRTSADVTVFGRMHMFQRFFARSKHFLYI